MLLVIPVSRSDIHLIPYFTASLKRCGGLKRHTAVIMSAPTVMDEAKKLAETLEELTSGAKLVSLQTEPQGGWPTACNLHFMETVEYLNATKNQLHWYWLELDNTPLKAGWADQIEDEYWREKKPYLGAEMPTWKVRNPNTPQSEAYQQDTHMVGTGVYPANHIHRGIFWKYPSTGMPFDVANQYEVKNAGLHPTKLIQHQFQTVNFRKEGDEIVCDDKEAKYGISYKGPLSPDAVVHHGCKDGSLERVIGDEARYAMAGALEAIRNNPDISPVTSIPEVALAVKMARAAAGISGSVKAEPATITTSSASAIVMEVDASLDIPLTPTGELHSRIREQLAKGSLRLADLAKAEGKDPKEMRAWLEANGFGVKGPGWVIAK